MTGERPETPRNRPDTAPAGDSQTLILQELRRIAQVQERMEDRFDDRLSRLERRLDDFEAGVDERAETTGVAPPAPTPRPVPPVGSAGSLEGVTVGGAGGTAEPPAVAPTPSADEEPPTGDGPRFGRDPDRLQVPPADRPRRRRGGTALAWLVVLIAIGAAAGWWAQTTGRLEPLVAQVRSLILEEEATPDMTAGVDGPADAVPADQAQSLAEADPAEGGMSAPSASDRVADVVADIAEDRAASPDGEAAEPVDAADTAASATGSDQASSTAGSESEEAAADPTASVDTTGSVGGTTDEAAAQQESAAADGAATDAQADAGQDGGAPERATPATDAQSEPTVPPETAEAQPTLDPTPPAADPDPPPAPAGAPDVVAAPPSPVDTAALEPVSADRAPLPQDASASLRELARLAVDGRPEAQHDLATAYALGRDVPRDYELAAYWYRRSASSGVPNALYNLGVLTQRGRGVAQDSALAFDYFLAAAEEGHPDAQNAVGLAYAEGRGVEADPLKAASWFQAASAAGNPRGAYHLGRLFEAGLDGAPDLDAAAGWYRIAAEAGDGDAREALDRIAGRAVAPVADTASEEVPVPDQAPAPVASGPEPLADEELTRDEVREVQQLLENAGFDPGPVDGLLGDQTRSAIEQWQQANGLPQTGEPTRRMLEMLRSPS